MSSETEPAYILNGATALNFIIGDPIAQVKSPAGMSRKLAARGRNAITVPIHIGSEDLKSFFESAKAIRNLESILITIPHKFDCYSHCTTVSKTAGLLRAVQHMRLDENGNWYGDNFDGASFVRAAKANGAPLEGAKTLLIGAGGAGSSIGLALLDAGVSSLSIHDADETRMNDLIAKLSGHTDAAVSAGSNDPSGFDVVANASPMGMKPEDPYPVDVTKLAPSTFVGCVVTSPEISPLIAKAREIGCSTSTGVEMSDAAQELGVLFAERKI